MKKTILISILVLLLCVVIAVPIVIKCRNKTGNLLINNTKEDSNSRTISNLKEYKGDVPIITLEFNGDYSAVVSIPEVTKDIPVYEFDAGIVNMYGTRVSKFVGIKYWDLITYLKVPHNTATKFISNRKEVSYRPMEIDYDKTYIVFYMDGKEINNSKLNLLSVNYNYLYSVENLVSVNIQK